MSSHTANLRIDHMNALIHIVAFLKHKTKLTIAFDPRHPFVTKDRFKNFDWEDTYRYTH